MAVRCLSIESKTRSVSFYGFMDLSHKVRCMSEIEDGVRVVWDSKRARRQSSAVCHRVNSRRCPRIPPQTNTIAAFCLFSRHSVAAPRDADGSSQKRLVQAARITLACRRRRLKSRNRQLNQINKEKPRNRQTKASSHIFRFKNLI
ncbi:unnamed protein product [Pieris brassicae]|uniref:Uncharacterized protein n=1 Tax=Pieris brassicae TaxID=7116 RepID=A0A9P0T2Q7_PIEBR|nr:unnamed protein product [Pieris brassicae]